MVRVLYFFGVSFIADSIHALYIAKQGSSFAGSKFVMVDKFRGWFTMDESQHLSVYGPNHL